jgi:ABC-2 type transport system permease protein
VIALARAELLKLRSTRTALGLFIVILVVTLIPLVALLAALPRDWLETDGVSGFLNTASALVPLVLLVFGILGMTNEYRHGTITYSYLVTPKRWQVMVVKLVVYALVGIVTMLVAMVLVYIALRSSPWPACSSGRSWSRTSSRWSSPRSACGCRSRCSTT